MAGRNIVVVHGGAGAMSAMVIDGILQKGLEQGVQQAAKAGYTALQAGGNAVQAVQAAITSLENNPNFNAGTGSCLNLAREVEMDASIMDGKTLNAGGIGCIQNIANPIQLAALVMEKTDHVLLVGKGAQQFAASQGVETVPTEQLVTDKAKKRRDQFDEFLPSANVEFKRRDDGTVEAVEAPDFPLGHDTVGAVCMDASGNICYGTSTGGITAKMPGRVGDSPLVGSGGYADNSVAGCSTTGHGESFIKTCLGLRIIQDIENGKAAQQAAEDQLKWMQERVGGTGGVVIIDKQGNVAVHFTSQGMSWAHIDSEKADIVNYGIYPGQHLTAPV